MFDHLTRCPEGASARGERTRTAPRTLVVRDPGTYGESMSKPPTYDEITRRTVVEPDSSFRPSPEQVRQAHEGFRALDGDEQQLHARVQAALAATGSALAGVTAEVERDRVTLRGTVPDPATLARAGDLVRAVDGVAAVTDQLVIAAR